MALFDHTIFLNRFELLIWKIKNPEKLEINNIANSIAKKIDSSKSILKKNQILAVHQILKFKGFCSDDLIYNKDGAPFLKNGLKISISHSGLFVAVCLSKEKMGVDNVNFKSFHCRYHNMRDVLRRCSTTENFCIQFNFFLSWYTLHF